MANPPPQIARGLRRWLYLIAGFASLVVGGIGVVVPLLPTTPFVILAAYFFARSSPTMHRRLLENRVFGPLIHQWSEHGAIPFRAKVLAVTMILVFGSIAIYLMPLLWAQLALAALFVAIISWLVTRPTATTFS